MMRGVPALAVLVAGAVVAMVPRPGDAQEPGVTLRGTVLDSLLAPVPDVVVRLLDAELASRTDSAGQFRLESIPPGHHTLSLQKPGFEARVFGFDLSDAQGGELDVGAIPLPPAPPPSLTLGGTIIDSQQGEPVDGVVVWLNGGVVTQTEPDGSFQARVVDVPWGANELELRRVGYIPQSYRFWVVASDAEIVFEELPMQSLPILLPEVIVLGERTVLASPRVAGFYRRMQGGFGYFVTQQDIAAMRPSYVSDVLRRVPGLMVGPSARLSAVSIQLNRALGRCDQPMIWLDGHRIDDVVQDLDLDAWVHPDNILGMEIYRGPSEIPPEFNRMPSGASESPMFGTGCGAIVIWTG